MKLFTANRRKGSTLLIVLACVTLVTILAIYLLMVTRFERSASRLTLNRVQAEIMSDYACAAAIERLREAIDEGRQPPDPNRDFYTTWSSEPGRIHIYKISQANGSITPTTRDMFSAPPGPDSASGEINNIDLNAASYSTVTVTTTDAGGNTVSTKKKLHPITGTADGTMKIGWTPILANPDLPASATNPATARIAYWIDDDSCKVDINTADGSAKNDPIATQVANNHFSYGFGTPSEISLQAFPEINALAGAGKSVAQAIAEYGASTGFNSIAEISRVTGVPATFFAEHPFDLTTHSLTPELTMTGEPRTYLTCGAYLYHSPPTVTPRAAAVGPYSVAKGPTNYYYGSGGYNFFTNGPGGIWGPLFHLFWSGNENDSYATQASGPMDFVYPEANQLPGSPPLFQPLTTSGYVNAMINAPDQAALLPYFQRVANSIYGKTSSGLTFHWPAFAGSTAGSPLSQNGFGAKYSLRQIDDLTLQIYDIANSCAFADQTGGITVPSMVFGGILNTTSDPTDHTPRTVSGLGRSPKLTEIYITATVSDLSINGTSNVPGMLFSYLYALYFPAGYAGAPLNPSWGYPGYRSTDKLFCPGVKVTNSSWYSGLNPLDSSTGAPNQFSASSFYPSPPNLHGYWSNTLLHIQDANDTTDLNTGGFDLSGTCEGAFDPDQGWAAQFHPYELVTDARIAANSTLAPWKDQYTGGCQAPPNTQFWAMQGGMFGAVPDFSPGTYLMGGASLPNLFFYLGKPGATNFNFKGGLSIILTSTGTDWGSNFDVVPLNSLRNNNGNGLSGSGDCTDPNVIADCQKAVIPAEFAMSMTQPGTFLARTSDPLVNQFPKDWQVFPNIDPDSPEITLLTSASLFNTAQINYCKGGAAVLDPVFGPHADSLARPVYDHDGDNPGFKASGGGDPLSVWLPRQDVRYPKQSRFPSVGGLNYVRTGRIPDDLTADIDQQKGTPWRSLNLASTSATSQTVHSVDYPDWALFDLFTVPFLPQKPCYIGGLVTDPTPLRELTAGGATEGKLNINNPATPYPFDQVFTGVTQTPPTRTAPLEALFYGLQTVGGAAATAYPGDVASPQTVDAAGAATLRAAVQSYLATNGAFMLPGQLAEVPAINAFTFTGVAANAQSRNDLMRQVIGATTTQSNTFSVWVVAQTFKKLPGNINYGTFEPGDVVTGQVRRHYTIERYIETGKDGVPGNAHDPGPDGIIGTADDPIDADYNPALTYPLPYRYRVSRVEDIAL